MLIELLASAEQKIAATSATPRLDAEVLLAHTLGVSRTDLYTKKEIPIGENVLNHFSASVSRRVMGAPIAYITGVKEFWSLPIKVTPDVLIPRPETELVVEETIKIVRAESRVTSHEPRILDLCTGSGCIAAALARELPYARFTVSDISKKALAVARENLSFAGDRVKFVQSDLFAGIYETFDLIVSNPPYIATKEKPKLSREILGHEPHLALFAGKTGLDFVTKIIENAAGALAPGSSLIMEISAGQASHLMEFASGLGKYSSIVTAKDLAGIDRVIKLTRE